MRITFDSAKRNKTLFEHGLDFDDAALVFAGITLEMEDTRKDYGEARFICYGMLECWKGGWSSWATHRVARIATSSV